ncbi:MAG: OmpA family protein [Deltaproteobacteria bacterium]|nr:OmpA family protein [Deltaproteobacteria bacterium]MBW2448242.1 OmpA family protein [Deltaproteobacteria bacterium]
MNILRISALLLTAAFVQGCASFGQECQDCCQRPTLAQAQQIQPPPAPAQPVTDACAGVIRLRGVNFDFDRAEIRPASRPILDQAASRLRKCGSEQLRVEGHTDSIGADAYNQDLSERRARTVRDYLVSKGLSGGRISSAGFGESRPISTNDTPEGRFLNRRVEVRFLD